VACDNKRLIVSTALASEFEVLAQAVNRLSGAIGAGATSPGQHPPPLREIVACFPCAHLRHPRRQNRGRRGDRGPGDCRARRRSRRWSRRSSTFCADPAAHAAAGTSAPDGGVDHVRFDVAMRFQHATPVQAKGIEDTAFYRYHLLASLNEVGGDPGQVGRSVADFHATNDARRRQWPRDMHNHDHTTPSAAKTPRAHQACSRRFPTRGSWRSRTGSV
jgi:(1->4)-alpha-D-glucan 1-alpha-D-glucosylmutase